LHEYAYEIISLYRKKDRIEKCYNNIKNSIGEKKNKSSFRIIYARKNVFKLFVFNSLF